ncbi:TRAP transporter small permease [Castellaniella sp. GW247-6E4]|uniref:TRAP transporter small permease n=1 Tax=Castellaniella sp. GW247-6E4 TaxID=3140380 RepID=UPI003315F017
MDRLIRWAGALSVLCLCGMVLILAATLALRPVGILVPSSEIIVTFLMVGMALFGFVYAYAEGVHVRVDALYQRMPASVRRGVGILNHVGGALLCAALTFHAGALAWMAFRFNDLSDGLVAIPMWIPLSTIPLGFGLLGLALLRDGWRLVRGREVRFGVSEMDGAVAMASSAREDGS